MTKYRPPKFVKKRRLKTILGRLRCGVDTSRGKGGHWVAFRPDPDSCGTLSFTFAGHREYGQDYIKAARRQLKLLPEHGVSHREFFEA